MPSLREIQSNFIEAITDGAQPLPEIIDAQRRLAIHRNNWRSNLRGALRGGYPVVEWLVGAEFFNYMADGFIEQYPSRSGNLEDYGSELADFIAAFAPAQTLPYLSDVARLEALIDEVLTAPDTNFQLRTASDTNYYRGAARLLHSPYPVQRIWQVNQPGWSGYHSVNLDEGAVVLLIRRDGFEIYLEPLAVDRPVQLIDNTGPESNN
jgi:hypothetical protein